MEKYAVFGNPIAQSKSPQIHLAFAAQFGIKLEYQKHLVEIGAFEQAINNLKENGGKGCNVTAPFKGDAFSMANQLSERAQLAEAVNTLTLCADGSILGDNTDGPGLVIDLENQNAPIKGKRILLIGAGGAARGVIKPLLQCEPEQLVICNRTYSKAQVLVEKFSIYGPIKAIEAEQLSQDGYDLVINSSSSSLTNELPPVPACIFNANTFAYDMSYKAIDTTFVSWAKEQGCATVIDGLGMLVGQAAESFYVWHGKRPNIIPVLEELRAQLTAN